MISDITKGNAVYDGKDFNFWFVGEIEKWCSDKGIPFDKKRYGLRNTDDVEIKWGIYKKGDVRDKWAGCSDRTALSIILRGDCIFRFCHGKDDIIKEFRLNREGDYLIWREDIEHTWEMLEDSVFFTLRWSSCIK